MFRQRPLSGVDHSIELVPRLDALTLLAVFLCVRLGVPHHLIDLVLTQSRRRGYGDLLLAPCAEILGRYIDDAVGIDIKGNFHLRYAARRRWNPNQMKLAKSPVLRCHRPFALKHMYLNGGLTVGSCRENLRLASRNGCVALDQFCKHTAKGLDTKTERSYVEQQQVLYLAAQHTSLNCSADSNNF